jgi:radical SAM protein with 4Fe4S-binding SPASM domain
MYLQNSTKTVATFKRPLAAKLTAAPDNERHILEDILSNPAMRAILRVITRQGPDGTCFFERLCANYDRPENWRWALPSAAIDLALTRARADKELWKRKLFHHRPTVKALALAARSVARHGLTRPQWFAAPLMVVWNITRACNLRCRHCYEDASGAPRENELTLEEKIGVVDQMGDAGVPFLAIAGGEPLVLRHLPEVLSHATRRGIHLTLATNGTLLTPERAAQLKELGVKYIEISVDSLDPAQHDAFRGVPGAWERAVQGIRNSVAAGIRTGLAACFTRRTVHMADEMIRFAIDLGCQTFSHFNFIPAGRGRAHADLDLEPEQRERLLRLLCDRLQENRINIISTAPQFGRACVTYAPPDGLFATGHAGRGPGGKTKVLARYIGGCGAGRCYCCIQPEGEVTPCVYISTEVVGNLRRNTLEELWECELFRVLADRDDRSDHCGVCDYRLYCGGCRARALAYTGDIQAGDPGCAWNRPVWDEVAAERQNQLPVLH